MVLVYKSAALNHYWILLLSTEVLWVLSVFRSLVFLSADFKRQSFDF